MQVMNRLRKWAAPPHFPDEEKNSLAYVLNVLLLSFLAAAGFLFLTIILFAPDQINRLPIPAGMFLLLFCLRLLLFRGHLQLASGLMIFGLWVILTIAVFTGGGITAPAFIGYIVIVLLCGLLLGYREALLAVIVNSIIVIILITTDDILLSRLQTSTPSQTLTGLAFISVFIAVTAITYLTTSRINQALHQAQQEIIEREKTETALRESEARYRELVDDARDVVFTLDREGEITTLNPAFETITGWKISDWLGVRLGRLIHAGNLPLANELFEGLRDSQTAVAPTEFAVSTASGSYLIMEISANPQVKDGETVGVLGIARDITLRKQSEEMLRQAQKLDSLGLLAGGIAHDFNNLLLVMMGQLSLALKQIPLKHSAHESIVKANHAAERAANLTRQLLAYSGFGEFEIRPHDFNMILKDSLPLLSVAVPEHIKTRTSFDFNIPTVNADIGQMQQVILNLVINAVQAIGNHPGEIIIRTSQQTISDVDVRYWLQTGRPLPPGDYVVLEVQDNGQGMDKYTQDHIFDPFFSTKQNGHGLGLAAVLGILRGHNGGVRVYSEKNQGTIFRLLFPASTKSEIKIVKETQPLPSKNRGVVLVIDDEKPVREAITDILDDAGIEVLTAANGAEGVALVKKEGAQINVVLLDLSMPDMDGAETFHALRAIQPNLQIILSSGYHEERATSELIGQGLADFLQKPYSFETLIGKIQAYL